MHHLAAHGFEAVSEVDRVLATVWLFAAEVGNGGFVGYYASARGDLAFLAPQALGTISAFQLAALAEKANAALGREGPPRDRKQRRELVRQLPEATRHRLKDLDREFSESTEDVDELMEQYLVLKAV